jgi:hypothetical protein
MKWLWFALVVACWAPPTVPAGYHPCRSDNDCHVGEYCGFVAVDTYAVCKVDPDRDYSNL